MLSGGHAKAQPFGEPSFPDVASRRDRAAGNSGNVRISSPRRAPVLEKPLAGSASSGSPTIFSPHLMTIPSDVRTVRYPAESRPATSGGVRGKARRRL